MKVKFKYGIQTYSGTVDEMVFGSYRNGTLCIGRKYVYPTITENNTSKGTIMKNLATVWADVSSGYKDEMKTYAQRNVVNLAKGMLPPTSFSIWVKMLFLFSKLDSGHIDLSTVTYTDIQTVGEDILSIAVAVENDYLAPVAGADELITNM